MFYCCDCIIKVDFQLQSEEGDTGTFIANGEWALLGMLYYMSYAS